jgi:isocitrate dehydrogenase (NAD+)
MQTQTAIPTIVVMHGDQTGEELLKEALRVLQPSVIRQPLEFADYDLSLESRRKTKNQVVWDSAEATCKTGLALKAATITPEIAGDVGSPNAILREALGASVILQDRATDSSNSPHRRRLRPHHHHSHGGG